MPDFDQARFLAQVGFGSVFPMRMVELPTPEMEERTPPPRPVPAAPSDPRRPLAGTPVPLELRDALARPAGRGDGFGHPA